LAEVNAVSKQDFDNAVAAAAQSKASAETARLTLVYTRLLAPISGRIGRSSVTECAMVTAAQTTALATVQQLDPIYVDFFLPQQVLDRLKTGQTVSIKVDTYPGQTFSGKILAINPQVDANSRNAQIRAALGNPDRKLLPGMYATVDIDMGPRERHITLPQTAITYNPYGSTVYLVQRNGTAATARQSFVTTGATRGAQVAVLSGVKDGDVVVTAGQVKLRNGSPLKIDNKVLPADSPNPPPTDH